MTYDVTYVTAARQGHEKAVTDECNEHSKDGWRLAQVVADHIESASLAGSRGGYTRGLFLFFEKD